MRAEFTAERNSRLGCQMAGEPGVGVRASAWPLRPCTQTPQPAALAVLRVGPVSAHRLPEAGAAGALENTASWNNTRLHREVRRPACAHTAIGQGMVISQGRGEGRALHPSSADGREPRGCLPPRWHPPGEVSALGDPELILSWFYGGSWEGNIPRPAARGTGRWGNGAREAILTGRLPHAAGPPAPTRLTRGSATPSHLRAAGSGQPGVSRFPPPCGASRTPVPLPESASSSVKWKHKLNITAVTRIRGWVRGMGIQQVLEKGDVLSFYCC